jgi:hypothetical protein
MPLAARAATIVVVLGLLAATGRAEPLPVDLELVLAVDVSRSIDDEEYILQKRGYAEAFRHPAVQGAIQANPHRRIAVTLLEWAGADFQRVVVPWTLVADGEGGVLFGEALLAAPRSFWGWTSISGAIDASVPLFGRGIYEGTRKVIDVSGDGVNNSGLVIMNDRPTPGFARQRPQPPLDDFYRENVIGGPGAFLIAIDDFESFAHAIVSKLIKEIAGWPAASGRSVVELLPR